MKTEERIRERLIQIIDQRQQNNVRMAGLSTSRPQYRSLMDRNMELAIIQATLEWVLSDTEVAQ